MTSFDLNKDCDLYLGKALSRRIRQSNYYKQFCFSCNIVGIIDLMMTIESIGGFYGTLSQPTPFIILLYKLISLKPEKGMILDLLIDDSFKYVRLLAVFYIRLVCTNHIDIYRYLEPLYNDYRKIRVQNSKGKFELTTVDQIIEVLLQIKDNKPEEEEEEDHYLNIIFPTLIPRHILSQQQPQLLPPRKSLLTQLLKGKKK